MSFQYARVTPAEYLEFEARASDRHEFIGGVIYAMVGGTRRHNEIISQLHTALAQRVSAPCRVYSQGMKLKIGADFFYPDLFVACAETPMDAAYETEATVIVEVASASSHDYDLNAKAGHYRRLPSLRAYAVVAPDQDTATVFTPDGHSHPGVPLAALIDRLSPRDPTAR